MPEQVFGNLIAFTDFEQALLEHYKTWMNTWLAARERYIEAVVGSIARPRSYIVKQTFTALPGEEQTPLVVAVCDGFTTEPERRGTGRHDALFRAGIAVVCMAGLEGQARELCGHYQTAIAGIALRHKVVGGGLAKLWDFVSIRIEDIDDEAAGRSLAAVRMELVYRIDGFVEERPVPELLPDVTEPQPDEPLVEDVLVEVGNYKADEELP